MKILITGGAGFLGLHLANHLLNDDYEVHLLDNFSRGQKDKDLKKTLSRSKIYSYDLDLLNKEQLLQLKNDFEIIIHLAAIIGVKHVEKQPHRVLLENNIMLSNIMDFAYRQNKLKSFLFASTSEVYAGTLKYFNLQIPTPENTPLALTSLNQPRTSYMLSKIYGEALCQYSDLPFIIFRPHNLYGPRMGMAHVIPEQLRKAYFAKDNSSINVSSTNHTRCFCYISDAVEMVKRFIEQENCIGNTFNVGVQEPEITIKELVQICHREVGKKLKIISGNDVADSPVRRSPDMTLTKKFIGYKPKVELHKGIAKTYEWYKSNIFEL